MIHWNPITYRYEAHPSNASAAYLDGMKPDKPTVIEAIYPPEWDALGLAALKKHALAYFDSHLKGLIVTNEKTQLSISFPKSGIKHTLRKSDDARNAYIVPILPLLVMHGKRTATKTEKYNRFTFVFQSRVLLKDQVYKVKVMAFREPKPDTPNNYTFHHIIWA